MFPRMPASLLAAFARSRLLHRSQTPVWYSNIESSSFRNFKTFLCRRLLATAPDRLQPSPARPKLHSSAPPLSSPISCWATGDSLLPTWALLDASLTFFYLRRSVTYLRPLDLGERTKVRDILYHVSFSYCEKPLFYRVCYQLLSLIPIFQSRCVYVDSSSSVI